MVSTLLKPVILSAGFLGEAKEKTKKCTRAQVHKGIRAQGIKTINKRNIE